MDMTSPPSNSRPLPKRLVSAGVVVALSAALFSAEGCSNSPAGPEEAPGTQGALTGAGTTSSAGANATAGAFSSGGAASIGNAGAAGTSTGGTGSSIGSAGTPPVNAGSDVGQGTNAGSGATSAGNPGTVSLEPEAPAEVCEDAEPPEDPEWPEATCVDWAADTDACTESWFDEYCDVSCGRCVPASGGGEPEPEVEVCEDVQPPEDPEWPDATCVDWAEETDACTEDWFDEYCDVSCGRCVPASGGGEPEPVVEVCEDVEPPEDPEWPGATCAEWSTESDACGEDWFSDYCDVSCGRCVPEGGIPAEPGGVDCSGEGLPNVTGGDGFATRYWDCCQTHCSQFGGQKCSQDGVSGTGDSQSSCDGGGSFACYNEAPYAVSDCLSYGHVAKANPDCGGCYRLQFSGQGEHNANDPGSKLIAGKQMIVKVSNTGSDVAGNQFDLMVPGGGVGMFNACSRQWGTDALGAQYGGFLTECSGSHAAKKECVRQECMKIPAGSARDGCIWFVDWLEVADNPRFTSEPTNCPF